MRGISFIAVCLAGLLVLSMSAVGGLATGSQDATAITQCTTITEPGSYELTTDLMYSGSNDCLEVATDDVTIDGNGHSISYDDSGDDTSYTGQGIRVANHDNVTIRGVTFEEFAMLDVHESTAVTIENNRFDESAIIDQSTNLVLHNNHFSSADAQLEDNEDVRITNNRIEDSKIVLAWSDAVTARGNVGDGRLNVEVRDGTATVANNSLSSIKVGGREGTSIDVRRNHVVDGGLTVVTHDVTRIHNNTVEGQGMTLEGTSDDVRVTHNTITNADIGVQIHDGRYGGPTVVLERNAITGNLIGIETALSATVIHQNDLSGNTEYGVVYTQADGVVDATNNYWGDRPSSPQDEHAPFEDSETGGLANGSGSAVSESAESGVSNVHFDPWLDTAPSAGVVEQPTDGDGSDDQTTTTTTTATTTATTATTTATTTASPPTTNATTTNPTTATPGTTETPPTTPTTTTTTSEDPTPTTDGTLTTATMTTSNETATSTTRTNTIIEATTEETGSDVPGFGHLSALVALLASALLVARRT